VDQGNQLVTAAPLIAPVPGIHLIGIDRVVVLVKQQLGRVLVVLVVGHEDVGGIAHKQSFGVEQLQRAQQAGHLGIEPGLEPVAVCVAGELA
jgi:UPF0716 family protein affecting phage T7 exclusion